MSAGPQESSARIARNTAIVAGAEVASKLASLAFYAVMARELGQGGFGDFTFGAALALVLVGISGLGLDLVVTRSVARSRQAVDTMFWNAIAVKLTFGAAGVALANLVVLVGGYPGQVRVAVAILTLAVLLEGVARTFDATFRGFENMAPIGVGLMLQRFSTAIIGIAAMTAGAGLVVVSLSYLAGTVLALAYLAWRLARVVAPRRIVSRDRARRLLIQSIPIGLGTIFGLVLARVDAVLLSILKDNVAVGIYGAGYQLFDATLFLTWAFGFAALPALSRLDRSTNPRIDEAFAIACKVVVAGIFPIGVAFALFATPIVETVFGHNFDDSVSVVRLLSLATALFGLSMVSMYLIISQDRQRVIGWIVGAVAVENIALNLIAIPRWSFDGAAAAMSLSQLTLTVLMLAFAIQAAGRISFGRVAAGPLAGCAAMGAVALALGSGYLGLALAVVAYPLVLYVVERRLFPDDLGVLLGSLRRLTLPQEEW